MKRKIYFSWVKIFKTKIAHLWKLVFQSDKRYFLGVSFAQIPNLAIILGFN
jgi:hypothetical protein